MRIMRLTQNMRLIRRHLAPPPSGGLHCNTLQHTATHCNALQLAATDCSTLQHTATLQQTARALDFSLRRPFINGSPTATHCNTLQHTATHCNTLQHTATHCNTLQRHASTLESALPG